MFGVRSFSITTARLAGTARADAKKKAAKYVAKKRIMAKIAPEKSSLYSTIPTALRYIRAAEVGMPLSATTITITSQIVQDRGTKPVSGAVRLPTPLKQIKVLVFTSDAAQVKVAQSFGALVGGKELVSEIQDGKIDLGQYDAAFATPEIKLGAIAKTLGPKGLMPSAKKGTVAEDLSNVLSSSLGTLPFKLKSNLLSVPVGRVNFTDEEILKNIIAVSKSVKEAAEKVPTKRPVLVGETVISSTKGPGFVINF